MAASPRIPDADRIPLFQKIMFALGERSDWAAIGLMTTVMWMPFFNIGLGLSPVVLGIILMILRAWDAINDPLMGNISDNARTRWGRRRPFLFVGAIGTALLYPLLWNFPQSVLDGSSWLASAADWIPFIGKLGLTAAQKSTALYLTFIGLVFFTVATVWSTPYYGLQLELTPNYDERTRLTAIMTLIAKLASFVTSWAFVTIVFVGTVAHGDLASLSSRPQWVQDFAAWISPVVQSLVDAPAGENPIVTGMRLMCWFVAAMILILGLLPALFVKERYYEKEVSKQALDPFWKSVRESGRCGPLWSLISVSFFLVMGYASIGGLWQYMNIYYVCGGDMVQAGTIAGVKGTVVAVSGIAMLPIFAWLGERYDKRTVVLFMLGLSMVGHLLNYWLMTPSLPYLQIVAGVFEASAISAVWMFLPSMKADVADYDEQFTHRRREGSINAFYSWFIKASYTASVGISGIVIQSTGFDSSFKQQETAVFEKMFTLYLWLPISIWAIALVAAWFYPLTRVRCAEIRSLLESRRGAV